MSEKEKNLSLNIETKSWIKETNDLYDFEAENLKKEKFTTTNENKSSYLITENNQMKLVKSPQEIHELLSINNKKDEIKIITELNYSNESSSFYITNSHYSNNVNQFFQKEDCERIYSILSKNDFTEIKQGDIIKLGRVRLKFNKIHFNNNFINENSETLYEISNNNNTNSHIIKNRNKPTFNYFNNDFSIPTNHNIFANSEIINNNNNNINNNQINYNTSYISNTNNAAALPNNLNDKSYITTANLSVCNNDNNNNNKNNSFYSKNCPNSTAIMKEQKNSCRICYGTDSDINDPLISPCKCTGSMGYIHYQCLKSCIKSKIQKKEECDYIVYAFKSYNCEICLQPYPKYITYKNITYNLVELDVKKFDQYAICDYNTFDDTKKKLFYKGIILFKIEDDKEITIGRTQTNKIKLKDISVSRRHCVFLKKNNKFLIKDLSSKFGSLYYIKKYININVNDNISLLSGKHFLSFNLIQNFSFFGNFFKFGCCSYKQIEEELNFNRENDKEDIFGNNANKAYDSNNNPNDSYSDIVLNLSKLYLDDETNSNYNIFIGGINSNYNFKQKSDDESFI